MKARAGAAMSLATAILTTAPVLATAPAVDAAQVQSVTTVNFEQDQRINSLTLQSGTDTFATKNAFGGAIVGSAAITNVATSINNSVQDGSMSWDLEMPGLDDLSGTSSSAFSLGVLDGLPEVPSGNPATYSGSSDLDWWYDRSASDLDGQGAPLHQLTAQFAGSTLQAGPGNLNLTLNFIGVALDAQLMNASLDAVSGPTSTPTTSSDAMPPGHLAAENVPPTLTSFGSMTSGRLKADLKTVALYDVLTPSSLTGTSCGNLYTTSNTLLDVFVSGCKASGFLNEINATQPDVSLDGNTYVFQVGANHMVSGCTKNGGADTLADCVANSAYSAYFTFTTDRIISGRPHTWPDAPTGVAAQRGDQSADVSWTAPVNDGGATVTSYQVTASPGGATCTWTTGPLGCTVSGLTNGTAYTFTVTATNAVGTGPASAASTAVTPAGLPSPPVTVAANPGDGAATVSWSAADANGSAVTGYAVTSSPDGMTCSTTGATQCTVSGLTNGTAYTFTVTTTNDIGTSTSSGASPAVTVGTPTAPTSVTASAGDHQATVSWTASAGNAAPVSSYDVLGSPGGLTCSTTGATVCTVTGLTNGTSYTFTVTATNTVGSGPPSLPSAPVTPADTTAPTVTTEATPVFTLTGHVGLSYTGHDLSSGVASYDVRYRRAPYNGGFGGYQYPASGTSDWQATTKTSVSLAVPRGYTYCLSVRARDVAGNVSSWSAERCTATALDDRALTASTGWTRGKGSVYYAGTVTATKTKQVQLSLSHVTARRLAVVVTRLSGGGTIGIYWKGTLIKKISLSASSTKNRQVISLPAFATTRTGSITIKTLTAGTTRIDGLGVSAR